MGRQFSVKPPSVSFVTVLVSQRRDHAVQGIFWQGHDFIAIVDPVTLKSPNKDSGWRGNRGWASMRHEMDVAVEPVQAMNPTTKRAEETAV